MAGHLFESISSGSSSTPKYSTFPSSLASILVVPMFSMPNLSVRLNWSSTFLRRYLHGIFSAGKDATQAFFGLHRHEVLLRPQYKRLQIGTVAGETELIKAPVPGQLSKVPYAEPTWLSQGYFSPYYSDNHRKFQTAVREFFETVVKPESIKCEESGKKISQEVVDKLAYVLPC